jgi:hypothetical protein
MSDKMVEEMALDPCPFCGSEAELKFDSLDERYSYGRRAWVRCQKCGGRTADFYHDETVGYADPTTADPKAIAAWNTRTPQAAATIAERWERGLFDAIAHGDDEHRAWLKEAITAHFAGEPVPPPRGRGTAERRMEEMRAERDKWKQRAFQLERKHGDLKGVFVEARAALRPSGGV